MKNKQKIKMGKRIVLIRTFVLKIINKERKLLIHHDIFDCISQQIVSVITQVNKESKLWMIHPSLRRPKFSFNYSIAFTHFCIVEIWTLKKGNLLKKIRNHH